ncbi:hypothetical protein O181_096525 [Austropuccinia psidii MF-1]|uniref:Uncharacterized protein n=1 Tax=Austropuccinia psidii MF-1 TaxID=1389203 RepID=A0A9Q3J7S9_9BASI|nr:hypothetical protein [Austropuccinia psidii MF-1]
MCKDKDWEMLQKNPPRSDELQAHPEKFPQRGGNSEILQLMESTIIQTSDQKYKGMPCQKEGGRQERSPNGCYQQATGQQTSKEGKKKKKKNGRKPYSPGFRIPKIQKYSMENVFNMARTLMEFKDKEEQRMRQPHFPKK